MFELWNRESGNVIGFFPTEDAALAAVRKVAEVEHNRSALATLFLGFEDARGRTKVVAEGTALLARAGIELPRGAVSPLVETRKRRPVAESKVWFVRPGHAISHKAASAASKTLSDARGRLLKRSSAGSALTQRMTKKRGGSKPKK